MIKMSRCHKNASLKNPNAYAKKSLTNKKSLTK